MKWYFTPLILSAVVGCAQPPAPIAHPAPPVSGPPASTYDKEKAMDMYLACLQANARKIDDGKSDAATIAFAIKDFCRSERAKVLAVYAQGMSNNAKHKFYAKLADEEMATATQVVLLRRADATRTETTRQAATRHEPSSKSPDEWGRCVLATVRKIDNGVAAAYSLALKVSAACEQFYGGSPGADVDTIASAIPRIRARQNDEAIITDIQPMPSGGSRL